MSSPDEKLNGSYDAPPLPIIFTPEEERRIWRKVDIRLMPILSLMYLLSFLDRGNAKLEGLTAQLNLTGDQYNIALLFRPSRWLPGITIIWGIIMTLMSLVKTYPQLVGVRICLGVAEAGLFPGVVYYLSLWYPRHMLQYRVGLFFGAATIAGAFSGLLAFAIGYMAGTAGLEGWSWIFLLEGLATIVVAVTALFILVDFPDTAAFLTQEERAFIIWRKSAFYDNSSVGEEENFATRHVWAAFADWQVWMHILVYMSIVAPLYGITLFLPFGYDTPISQLLTVPPYVVATIVLLVFAHYSDKLKTRSPFVLAGLVMCLIGFSINISNASSGAKYFGTFFCVTGSYAAFPGIVCWLGNNLAGQYKRGVGMALHIGIGNLSGAVASNIYRTQDSPRFILGHGIELMFVGIGFITLPIIVLVYRRINRRRDEDARLALEQGEKNRYTPQELRELGDRAPDFRYTY
ncbi:MFS general substrate transporter [Leucogyrophana mollusca]|uniref:MFS general substrate transporter n=1 Tax=Leucogyrophana mollusca TaxID=85980 RepID=A0ACB8B9N2_9AGAM|nr:MFS general substrate transporter [Leucogyrophana mollusca]